MAKKLKDVKQLLKDLEKVFNKYIRARDTVNECLCISCRKVLRPGIDKIDAGHWFSKRYSFIRFHEDNVNAQCYTCNHHLGGNGGPYRINLVQKIGLERVQYLEDNYLNPVKWDKFELMDLIEEYKFKLKEY